MRITKKQEVTEMQQIVVHYKCDFCNKISDTEEFPKTWHSFDHHHHEWDDTFEYFDVCSIDCYFKQLVKSLKEMQSYESAEIGGMTPEFVKELIIKSK